MHPLSSTPLCQGTAIITITSQSPSSYPHKHRCQPPQALWHFAISFDAIVLNDRSTPANKAEKHFGPAPSRILAASFFTRNGFYKIAGAFGHKRLNSHTKKPLLLIWQD